MTSPLRTATAAAALIAALALVPAAHALPDPLERVTGGSQAPSQEDEGQGGAEQPAEKPADDGAEAPREERPGQDHGGTAAGDPSFVAEELEVNARRRTLLKRRLRFRGKVAPRDAGRRVAIQRYSTKLGWITAKVTRSSRTDGGFAVLWRTDHIGRFRMRAVVVGDGDGSASSAQATSRVLRVTVYLPAVATHYGPGFYGRRTACGSRLTERTVGVAHRTLKCGTRVSFLYRGRTKVLEVIDRGPYANGADWDLTTAAARALRMRGTSRLGAVTMR